MKLKLPVRASVRVHYHDDQSAALWQRVYYKLVSLAVAHGGLGEDILLGSYFVARPRTDSYSIPTSFTLALLLQS